MQHEVEETEGGYPLALELRRGPVKVGVYYDEVPWNPRKEYDGGVGEIILHRDGYSLGDEGPKQEAWLNLARTYGAYRNARSLAGSLTERKGSLPDAHWHTWPDTAAEVDWKESVDVRVLIPLDLQFGGNADPMYLRHDSPIIGQKACRAYIGAMLEGDEELDGLYVATRDTVEAECGNMRPESLRRMAGIMEGQLQEYADYVAGEVFYIRSEDHNGDEEVVGGFIGEKYARQEAEAELDDMYRRYVAEVGDVAAWARSMGETLAGTYPPMEVPV
jgi:hypothetical protein